MNPPDQPTPRTNAIAHRGYPEPAYIVEMTDLARILERELTETERQRFGADADRRQLRCDLSDAKAEASHYMAVAQKATDELIFFRADNLKAHQMTCAAGLERDSLRAEVEDLKARITQDHGIIELMEAELKDLKSAGGPPFIRSEAIRNLRDQVCGLNARAELAEAELARLRALFPEILAALRNGAGCTADVSVGFLESVPNEVASVVSRLRAEVERLTPYVSKAILTHGGTMLCSPQVGVAFNEQQARAEKAEAEVERWQTVAATMSQEREHNANEASRLRAELQAELAAMKDTPTL